MDSDEDTGYYGANISPIKPMRGPACHGIAMLKTSREQRAILPGHAQEEAPPRGGKEGQVATLRRSQIASRRGECRVRFVRLLLQLRAVSLRGDIAPPWAGLPAFTRICFRVRDVRTAHAGAPQRAETQKRREVNNAQRSSREFTRDADCGQSEGLPRHGVRGVTGCPSRGLPPAVSLALLAVANGAILPSPFLWPRNGRACCNKLCPPPPRASRTEMSERNDADARKGTSSNLP
ncbi:unnamed protein product [Lampetra planeri]